MKVFIRRFLSAKRISVYTFLLTYPFLRCFTCHILADFDT